MTQRILIGDVREKLRELPERSVQCCVTSPPYWGLRDYGVEGQIGNERTPEEYVATMVEVFREVHRVLRDDGTLWLNLGDTYNAYNGNRGASKSLSSAVEEAVPKLSKGAGLTCASLKNKDLCGIPWRVVLALQADGWYWRDTIIWHKPAPMPSSVKDRTCCAHEPVFMLTKNERYFYDWLAISEACVTGAKGSKFNSGKTGVYQVRCSDKPRTDATRRLARSVWRINPKGFKGAHFATFPPALAERCIAAGTPSQGVCGECGTPLVRMVDTVRVPTRPGTNSKVNRASDDPDSPYEQHTGSVVGNRDPKRHISEYVTTGWMPKCKCDCLTRRPAVVLDPFLGSGTTLAVAKELGRDGVGIELNADYAAMARTRIDAAQPRIVELMEVG